MNVNLDDYFRSAFEEKLLVKMPEKEDDYLTPATRLLEKRREMQEVDQALAAQKEEFQMKMESLQQRKEELERKEYQLKESLLKFDKFLKENDAKKARAEKKAAAERELQKEKDVDIAKLKQDIEKYTRIRDELQAKMDQYSVHHKYLERVIEKSEDFNEIREVIDRFETLTATQKDLLTRDRKNQETAENYKQHLKKFKEEKNNEILHYNNQLAILQTKLEEAQSEALKWEAKWTHIKSTAAKKTLILGRVKMATHNLYLLVNKHQKQPDDIEVDNTEEQLNRVKTFILDLAQITTQIKSDMQSSTNSISQNAMNS